MRVALVPRSAEIQPGFSRFVNIYLFFFFFFLNPLPSSSYWSSYKTTQYNNLNSRHSAPQRKDANILRPVRFRCLVDLRLWRVFQKKHTRIPPKAPWSGSRRLCTGRNQNTEISKLASFQNPLRTSSNDLPEFGRTRPRTRAHLVPIFSWGKNFTNPMLPCHVRGPVRIIFVPMILRFH